MKTLQFSVPYPGSYGDMSYEYLEIKDDATPGELKVLVEQKGKEIVDKRKREHSFSIAAYFEPFSKSLPKTIHIVEYDKQTHRATPKGLKLKASLSYIKATMMNGEKKETYWYSLVE